MELGTHDKKFHYFHSFTFLTANLHQTDPFTSTSFFQCFDTVGWAMLPVKLVPEKTDYVSSGTLNHTHSLTRLQGTQSITTTGRQTEHKTECGWLMTRLTLTTLFTSQLIVHQLYSQPSSCPTLYVHSTADQLPNMSLL